LLIAQGLPRGMNLQEKFLMSRMSAAVLFNDRILTRIVQMIGRCTRSPTDYSAIVISGEELLNYLMNKEKRKFFHPELQSELDYGIEQSTVEKKELIENFGLFLEHSEEWMNAEEDIIEKRSAMVQEPLPGTECLRTAVKHEIKYQYCLWNSDFIGALESCRSVLATLVDPNLKGYRALWQYLAGSTAYLGAKHGIQALDSKAREHFSESAKAATGLPWLNRLSSYRQESDSQPLAHHETLIVIERMENILEDLGTFHNRKYDEKEKLILDGILSCEPKKFEYAHMELGQLLGYDAGNKETNGAPDPWWLVNDAFCFIFEDHCEAKSESSLNVTKARQVGSHPNWVKANLSVKNDAEIMAILISPVKRADSDAIPHLSNVHYWGLEDFRQWAKNALSVIRELRRTFAESGNLEWRAQAVEVYEHHKLSPHSLANHLRQSPAAQMLQV
jgi:hypothetical protein